MTSEAQKEAREEAERRWPDWVCPPVDDPEPDYSELDARWQNAESEMQRNAFVAGAAWQASRAPQPTDDREALALVISEARSSLMTTEFDRGIADAIFDWMREQGFRRAPAEPAVTEEGSNG